MNNEKIKEKYSFNDLFDILSNNIKEAHYEDLLFQIADAYNGYQFYLPAFLDFRGRIYRCGILHFHERDLARSLIMFSNTKKEMNLENDSYQALIASSFHYKSFINLNESHNWLETNYSKLSSWESALYEYAPSAKSPFQFLAKLFNIQNGNENLIAQIPIFQDASSSAYQLMSYFLLNRNLAERTNLIPR